MANYITSDLVAAFAQEFDALNSEGQTLLIQAASRLFDNLCEVEADFFKQSDGESDKVVYGDGTAYLKLPPYTSLGVDPIVIVDDEDDEQTVPDYFEQNGYLVIRGYGQGVPLDGTGVTVTPSPWPSDRIFTTSATNFEGWPVNWEITVSAAWGFTVVPYDVQQAVIQLAVHLWRTSDPAFTVISQAGAANAAPSIPAQVQAVVEKYKAKYSQTALFA